MNIIIVGYGRVGANLASILGSSHSVTVVDSDPAVLARVDQDFAGRVVLGLGYDENTLVEAGIETCDALAAVTSSDNVNLMTTEVARYLYHVPHVITRLVNPARLEIYKQLGLDYVCDTEIVAEDIASKIRSHRSHHLDTFGSYEVLSFALKADAAMTLESIESLGDLQVNLVEHDGFVVRPSRRATIYPGDTLLATVHEDSLPQLSPYIQD